MQVMLQLPQEELARDTNVVLSPFSNLFQNISNSEGDKLLLGLLQVKSSISEMEIWISNSDTYFLNKISISTLRGLGQY